MVGLFPFDDESYQTPNTHIAKRRETAGAKIRRQKGNNPDHQLRSLNSS